MPSQKIILDCLSRLKVFDADVGKVRAGNLYDGGYIVPDDFDGIEGVISIGIGDDVSFDKFFADRDIRVFQYDHTVDGPPSTHDSFVFKKTGWGGVEDGSVISLQQMLEENGLDSDDLVLKFDVEGDEWSALGYISASLLKKFRFIVCEIHSLSMLGDDNFFKKFQNAVDLLTTHHRVVHLHGNNCCGIRVVEGIPLPNVLEVTLYRMDRSQFFPSSSPIPSEIDFPNIQNEPDLILTPFFLHNSHAHSASIFQRQASVANQDALELDIYRAGIEEIRDQIRLKTGSLDSMARSVENTNEMLRNFKEENNILKSGMESFEESIRESLDKIAREFENFQGLVEEPQRANALLRNEISELREVLKNKTEEVAELKTRFSKQMEDNELLGEKVLLLEETLCLRENQLNEKDEKLNSAQELCDTLAGKCDEITGECQELTLKNDFLEKAIVEKNEMLDITSHENAKLSEHVSYVEKTQNVLVSELLVALFGEATKFIHKDFERFDSGCYLKLNEDVKAFLSG